MNSNRSDFQPQPLPGEFSTACDHVAGRLGPFAGRILYFPTVGSTSDVVAAHAAAGAAEGLVVVADEQTSGRGRRGRTWFSPPGSGLYLSVLLRPAPEAAALLTVAAGVGLADAIRAATGLAVTIKWPNDLVLGPRKLCGILAEGAGQGGDLQHVVLGIGINVKASAYPPAIADRATSLEEELGRRVDRGMVCAEALAGLAARYADLRAARFDAILSDWRVLAPGAFGRAVAWQGPAGTLEGITAGIDGTGALLVRTASGLERVTAGEVIWRERSG